MSNPKLWKNKKVILHERKRYTAHCVASARSAALSSDRRVPPSSPDGEEGG